VNARSKRKKTHQSKNYEKSSRSVPVCKQREKWANLSDKARIVSTTDQKATARALEMQILTSKGGGIHTQSRRTKKNSTPTQKPERIQKNDEITFKGCNATELNKAIPALLLLLL
jgi:hypothetical protein